MRIGRARECGELLMFDEVRRRLDLGLPQYEGEETIALSDIVGTVGRAGDFDGCWRPRKAALRKRLAEIQAADPSGLNEAIDVVRVDHAYFVIDGHKRVAIGKATGREFIDARISAAATGYELAAGVGVDSIDRTARERDFRERTGLLTAVPAARFEVTKVEGYVELQEALESYAYGLSQRLGKLLPREEAAALWYECVYRPTVEAAHAARALMRHCYTDADVFLTLHKQSRLLWGDEPRIALEHADELVKTVLADLDPDPSVISRLVQRARRRRPPQLLAQREPAPAP